MPLSDQQLQQLTDRRKTVGKRMAELIAIGTAKSRAVTMLALELNVTTTTIWSDLSFLKNHKS